MPRFLSPEGSVVNVSDADALGLGDGFTPYPSDADDDDDADGSEDYNPAEHTVEEVLAYMADLDDEERASVLEAERLGKNRKGLVEQ